MGGSGKTVVASSIARDLEVGNRFSTICFVGVGQDADGRAAGGFDFLHRGVQGFLIADTVDDDVGAVGGEGKRGGFPDGAGRSRDDGGLARQ